jgi:hypothetical protein
MMIRTLNLDEPLDILEEECRNTHVALMARPLTAPLAAPFLELRQDWFTLQATELQLNAAIALANAMAFVVDEELNTICDGVKSVVLVDVKNNRAAPLFQRYYGNQTPSELKKPILGTQLATMRTWVPSLTDSPNNTMKDYGEQLSGVVAKADEAVATQLVAQQMFDDFTIGERKTFVDKFNALRKTTYGKLAEMPHSYPALNLPKSFADGFFAHPMGGRTPALSELAREINVLKNRLKRREDLYSEIEAKEALAMKKRQDAELAALAADVAKADKKRAEAAQRLAKAQEKFDVAMQ